MRILIADDDPAMRSLLEKFLTLWGYEVLAATDGAEALEIMQKEQITFVISDWVMPNMNGLELCDRIRKTSPKSGYVYIILLTARDKKDELIIGLEAGADDFLSKPFNKGELKARIQAGERIVNLEHDLAERNHELREANVELNKTYSLIKRDLEAAAKIQESLLPSSAIEINGFKFDRIFCPSSFVAGDIFNFFKLDENHVGFYIIDVAGHGIPAALLSVTLSRTLSPLPSHHSPLKYFIPRPPHYEIRQPAGAVSILNEQFQDNSDILQYFTMIYAIMDLRTGQIKLTQAGHPAPVLVPLNGAITTIGSGGLPVAMFPDVQYDDLECNLEPGDKLFMYSDGVTECSDPSGTLFSESRLLGLLEKNRGLTLGEVMQNLEKNLRDWRQDEEFEDDVTMVAIERLPLKSTF